jgi:aminoglycoside 2'-N-acetyltransferase I
LRIVSYPESAVPPDLRRQMVALQDQAWPSDRPTDPAPWHDQALAPVSVLLIDDDEQVLSALDILSKPIAHASETFDASGISALVTDERLRGKGYGRRTAREAIGLMREMGADLGIFTCDSPLQGFYEAAGWQDLPGTVLIGGTPGAPFPSDRFDKVTMGSFFTPKAKAAEAAFIGARIELYPGLIDRLW